MSMFKMVRTSADKIVGYAPGEIITYEVILKNQGLSAVAGTITLTNMKANDGEGYTVEDNGAKVILDPVDTFGSVVVTTQRLVTEDDIEAFGDDKRADSITTTAIYDYPAGSLHAEVTSEPVILRRPDYAVAFGMQETSVPLNSQTPDPIFMYFACDGGYLGNPKSQANASVNWTMLTEPIPPYEDVVTADTGYITKARAIIDGYTPEGTNPFGGLPVFTLNGQDFQLNFVSNTKENGCIYECDLGGKKIINKGDNIMFSFENMETNEAAEISDNGSPYNFGHIAVGFSPTDAVLITGDYNIVEDGRSLARVGIGYNSRT